MFRLGIVDFDSSHCVEFTRRFNHVGVSRDQYVEGARVVMGATNPSEMSPERIPGHSKILADCGVEVVNSTDQLLGQVDGVLVLSVCGQSHLESARLFLEAGLPTFVDKPFACNGDDAQAMADLAKESGGLLWSSSALRFAEEVQTLSTHGSPFGEVQGVVTFGPAIRAAGNPGLLHYGIHAAELLFTLMGDACERVACLHQADADLVTAQFADGQIGSLRGTRSGSSAYGFTAFCEEGVVHQLVSTRFAYRNLCRAILDSFLSGQPPVPLETTLKLIRFLLDATKSEQSDGQWIALS